MRRFIAIVFVAMALTCALCTQLVASVQSAGFTRSYAFIDYPAWVKNSTFRDTNFTIINNGDADLIYTISTFETAGPSGWLTFSAFSGTVPSGVGNTETGKFRLNTTLASAPANSSVLLSGGMIFTSDAPTSPDTIAIKVWIADTLIWPDWDTLYVTSAAKGVNRKGLTVSNNGGSGNKGIGGVNLDFADWGDCDPTADVYLNEGSVAVGYVTGTDTNMYYNMLGSNWLSETGLRPVKGIWRTEVATCSAGKYTVAYSGRFTTADSNITMEKIWYAPILSGTGTADSAWMIQGLKVWNSSGATLSNVVIGEIADWNIPSDSGYRNSSEYNPLKNLIYQQGGEFNDAGECQNNDARFGAIRYLGGYKNMLTSIPGPLGGYARDLATDTSMSGTFIETNLFNNMQSPDFAASGSVADQYSVITYANNLTLFTTDTLRFYTAWLTVENGNLTDLETMADRALNWYNDKVIKFMPFDAMCIMIPDCVREGDFNHSGAVNVVDITAYISYLFRGGPAPAMIGEADVNDDGKVNILDVTRLVCWLFTFDLCTLGTCP